MLAPCLLTLTLVGIYPLFYSIYISLTAYQPTNPLGYQGWVGLDNYVDAASDSALWHSLYLTLVFSLSSMGISLVLGMVLALLFNQRLPGLGVLRTFVLIPMLVTPLAVGITWRIIYNSDLGVINHLLQLVGITRQKWLGSMDQSMISIVLVDAWQWTPFMFLILFAALRSLPRSPMEAARIDGCGKWQTFRYVVLPLLKPVIVLVVLLRFIDAVRTYDQVFMMTRGGPNLTTDIISIYLQRINFRFFDIGYGAALSWFFMGMLLIIVILFVKYTGFLRQMAEKEAK